MTKLTQLIFAAVVCFALLIGFSQVSSDNELFAEVMANCCNNGICDQAPCSYTSTVSFYQGQSPEPTITCQQCMDYIRAGQVWNYSGPSPTWCYNGSTKYYGIDPPDPQLNASISGPNSLAHKENGTYTADVSGGTGSYSYEWRRRNVGFSTWSGVLSTSSSVVLGMTQSADFEIQLKVTSGTQTKYAYKTVSFFDGLPKSNEGEETSALSNDFILQQNYPNPFNPTTQISYNIPKQSFVSIKVYDALGKEVANLVSKTQSEGYYTVSFNAANLPSGIYFYTFNTGNYNETKKMILTK